VEIDHITAYISLGSNLGDRAGNLLLAVRGLMEASFDVTKLSGIYETEPVGVEGHDNFLNMVAEVRVAGITPSQVMARMLRIEYLLGRKDKFLKKPRTADLDLLFYADAVQENSFVTLPHPRLHLRKFILVPMCEIAPGFVHPVFEKNMQELLGELDDEKDVKRWNPNTASDRTRSNGEG
jgi:2-amino-4-hydroxy-6-hydroxymethyldihydropteridine diphosphokinase